MLRYSWCHSPEERRCWDTDANRGGCRRGNISSAGWSFVCRSIKLISTGDINRSLVRKQPNVSILFYPSVLSHISGAYLPNHQTQHIRIKSLVHLYIKYPILLPARYTALGMMCGPMYGIDIYYQPRSTSAISICYLPMSAPLCFPYYVSMKLASNSEHRGTITM